MNKLRVLLVLGHLVTSYKEVQGYRFFEHINQTETFCGYKHHYIINPTSTCCNMTLLEPGIQLGQHWEACAKSDSQESASNAQQAAWAVYACILKMYINEESTINLKKFAELMIVKYPEETIKSNIVKEVDSVGELSADVSNSQDLDKLRTTYFDIEREVCSEMPSKSKSYGQARSCEVWEEDHRGGRCCEKGSFPFDIGFNSFMGQDLTPKVESCRKQLQTSVFANFRNFSYAMESIIVDICDLSCELIETGKLMANQLEEKNVLEINFEEVGNKLLPTWLPSKVKQQAISFALEKLNANNTYERMKNFEFDDARDENDFLVESKKFPDDVVHIPAICAAHREILTFVELFLYTKVTIQVD